MNNQPISAYAPDGTFVVRGQALEELIEHASFVDCIFLLLRERTPSDNERAMLNAVLIACCDHGDEPPSTAAARVASSTGNALHASIAAGVLAMGPKHGCAVTPAMEIFMQKLSPSEIVDRAIKKKYRLPGFGHKLYTDADPRTIALLAKAKTLGYHEGAIKTALEVEQRLSAAKGKKLPLNIDGALAAILLELRFLPETGNVLFLLGRIPGLAAHALVTAQSFSYIR